MQILTYVALYFVIWWLCLFMTLPFGVHAQHEDGEVTDGTDPGAPKVTFLARKLIATTILAAILMGLALWGLSNEALLAYWS